MSRQIAFTPRAAKPPAAYSQAVKAAGLVFVSGTSPAHAQTGAIVGSAIQEQTRQCLKNVQAILEAAGSSLAKALSFRWFPDSCRRIPGLKVSIAAIAEA